MLQDDRDAVADSVRLLADLVAVPTLAATTALLASLRESSISRLLAVGRAHGIEAWLAACAPSIDGPWAPLAEQRSRFLAARMRTAALLDDLTDIFSELGCPWLVLKGPALEHSVYPRPDLRHSVDLDILVAPGRFGEVLSVLQAIGGFDLLDRNWPVIADLVPGELRLRSPRGILVDLHWAVVNDETLRRRFVMTTSSLLDRRRWLDPPGISALCAADQLVHLGIHGALSGANRLMWLLDADLAARRIEDWAEVVAAAETSGAGGALALVLARAQRLWGTPVPRAVLMVLAGSKLKLEVDRVVDRTALPTDPDAPALGRSWARSTRPTTRRTILEFGEHGLAWLRTGFPRNRRVSPFADARDRRSPLFRADDASARDRYLDSVSVRS
jgi:hypothetical protein